ncbi:uncharacterized protein THITE_2055849, partial [Thermothielavioides terrestris NRRL 8126]
AWIAFIMGTLKVVATFTSLNYVGARWLVRFLFRTVGQRPIMTLRRMTDELVSKRLAMEKGRDDQFEGFLRYREEWTLKKLALEVRRAFSRADDITLNAVAQLPYLNEVIDESLRMYPPAAADLVRIVPPEQKLIAGHYVAGGSFVEVQPWSINHSSDNWIDPWQFNPDRFLHGADAARKEGNILEVSQPFSVGQRTASDGGDLAFAEMRLILARIIFNFDMELGEGAQNWIGRQRTLPLWSRIPLNVHFTPVKHGVPELYDGNVTGPSQSPYIG